MKVVQFYFSVGSRYSYLAATQVPGLSLEADANFEWIALNSKELIAKAGVDPFRADLRRGQYDPAYRTRDANRWAALYGVPYNEPDFSKIDGKLMALACIAARRLGPGQIFARRLFKAWFVDGLAPDTDEALAKLGREASMDGQAFITAIHAPETAAQHEQNIARALAAGAFGVPTFVVDGEVFWGQDRLPLLRQYLMAHKPADDA
ncbi:MAG: DsbA family protein [Rhodospirillaceae bacterium]